MQPDRQVRNGETPGNGNYPEGVFAEDQELVPAVERRKRPRTRGAPPTRPPRLEHYEPLVGKAEVDEIRFLAQGLRGKTVGMISAADVAAGIPDILNRLVPLLRELDVKARWESFPAADRLAEVNATFRKALQNSSQELSRHQRELFLHYNEEKRKALNLDQEFVVVHDVLPLALIEAKRDTVQKWIWRCHSDLGQPSPSLWSLLQPFAERYDAGIFSTQVFAPQLAIPQYLFYSCIDPLSDTNRPLNPAEIQQTCEALGIDRSRSLLTQISPFDRDHDALGVIEAYRLAKKYVDCQLVLAGTAAADDPECAAELVRLQEEASKDDDIVVVQLSASQQTEVNALQRASTVVIHKPLREGFGVTVADALWKGKATVASAVGGLPNQVIHNITGALVNSVEGCAYQIRLLLTHPEVAEQLGRNGREHVKENFLLTSNLKRWLLLLHILSEDPPMRNQ